jgi:hypothetical protein
VSGRGLADHLERGIVVEGSRDAFAHKREIIGDDDTDLHDL